MYTKKHAVPTIIIYVVGKLNNSVFTEPSMKQLHTRDSPYITQELNVQS